MRRNSVRVVRVIFYPRIDVHPVHFPSLSSILRERLFKAAFIWGDERLDPAHKDCSAVQRFLVVELSMAIVEVSDHGLAQSAVVLVAHTWFHWRAWGSYRRKVRPSM